MTKNTGYTGKKEILLAENSGFCFGVWQAIEKTEAEIIKKKEIVGIKSIQFLLLGLMMLHQCIQIYFKFILQMDMLIIEEVIFLLEKYKLLNIFQRMVQN